MVKSLPANVGDVRDGGLIPGLGRAPGEGNGNLLQFSRLEKPMDRGAWWATVQGVSKSPTCPLVGVPWFLLIFLALFSA